MSRGWRWVAAAPKPKATGPFQARPVQTMLPKRGTSNHWRGCAASKMELHSCLQGGGKYSLINTLATRPRVFAYACTLVTLFWLLVRFNLSLFMTFIFIAQCTLTRMETWLTSFMKRRWWRKTAEKEPNWRGFRRTLYLRWQKMHRICVNKHTRFVLTLSLSLYRESLSWIIPAFM